MAAQPVALMSTVKDVAAATARVVAIDPPSANRAVVKPREYPALHHGSKREKSIARPRQRRNNVPAGPATHMEARRDGHEPGVLIFDGGRQHRSGCRADLHCAPAPCDGERQNDEPSPDQSLRGFGHRYPSLPLCPQACSASSSATRRRVFAPFSMSSMGVNSSSQWLRPPREGTKIIPAGPIAAMYWASWPAPDRMRR